MWPFYKDPAATNAPFTTRRAFAILLTAFCFCLCLCPWICFLCPCFCCFCFCLSSWFPRWPRQCPHRWVYLQFVFDRQLHSTVAIGWVPHGTADRLTRSPQLLAASLLWSAVLFRFWWWAPQVALDQKSDCWDVWCPITCPILQQVQKKDCLPYHMWWQCSDQCLALQHKLSTRSNPASLRLVLVCVLLLTNAAQMIIENFFLDLTHSLWLLWSSVLPGLVTLKSATGCETEEPRVPVCMEATCSMALTSISLPSMILRGHHYMCLSGCQTEPIHWWPQQHVSSRTMLRSAKELSWAMLCLCPMTRPVWGQNGPWRVLSWQHIIGAERQDFPVSTKSFSVSDLSFPEPHLLHRRSILKRKPTENSI